MNEKCPKCKSKLLYKDRNKGEKVCAKCGLILTESMKDVEKTVVDD